MAWTNWLLLNNSIRPWFPSLKTIIRQKKRSFFSSVHSFHFSPSAILLAERNNLCKLYIIYMLSWSWFQREPLASILWNRFLENYVKLRSVFSIKLLASSVQLFFLKKRLLYWCFPLSYSKCLRTSLFVSQSIAFLLQNSWYSSRLKDVINHGSKDVRKPVSTTVKGMEKSRSSRPEVCCKNIANFTGNICVGVSF